MNSPVRGIPRTALGCVAFALLTAPATADAKYLIPLQGAGAMTLSYTTSTEPLWNSASEGPAIFDVVSPLRLSVPVIGPPSGHGVKRLVVTVTGVNCYSNCTSRTWRLKVPRLGADGYTRRKMTTPPWGCGRPVITAYLELTSGKRTGKVRWKPDTECGE